MHRTVARLKCKSNLKWSSLHCTMKRSKENGDFNYPWQIKDRREK